jgi:hypothetical protein
MSRLILAVIITMALSGCVARQYEWNNYDGQLFRYYKDPTTANEFRTSMQGHLEMLESKGMRPAPGLYAELGTLYLERGDDKTALVYYRKERETWQDSKYLMDTMISSIEKRSQREAVK